jgi:hypothetical protein
MKYVKPINEYFGNISEGINYNNAVDADLEAVGATLANDDYPYNHSEEALIDMGRESLKNAKPIPLTGIVKKDLPALLKYIGPAFKKCGVELDVDNTVIDSSNFANELMIPVAGTEYYLFTILDYRELAYNGSEFVIGATFNSDEEGTLDEGQIADLSNQGQVLKACTEFNEYLKNTQK